MDYSELAKSGNPTGFTNNWLSSRHNDKLFSTRYADFPLYDEPRKDQSKVFSRAENNTYRDILKTIQVRSPLSDMFFSRANIDHLKHLFCRKIYTDSGGKYKLTPESQSDNEILIVMRAIFLQHSKNIMDPDKLLSQVGELNLKVLLDIIPDSLARVQQELTYQRDHGSQPMPLAHPEHVSSAGTRTNRSVTDLFI